MVSSNLNKKAPFGQEVHESFLQTNKLRPKHHKHHPNHVPNVYKTRFISAEKYAYLNVHCVSKNDSDVAHYNFNAHQPILAIFGRDIAERICY